MMRLILCQYKTDSEIRGYKALQIIERSNELTGVSLHEERETDNPEVLIHPKGKQWIIQDHVLVVAHDDPAYPNKER